MARGPLAGGARRQRAAPSSGLHQDPRWEWLSVRAASRRLTARIPGFV